jgi:hypothetical protein
MVNIVIAADLYTRDRAALQGAFVLIDGVLQKDHKATPHFAHAQSPRSAAEWEWVRALFAAKRRTHAGRISMWLCNTSTMCKS